MKQRVNMGIIQMASRVGDVEFNVAKAAAFIEKAAGEGAHFVCLPELFATGYNMEILGRGIIDLSERYHGYIREKMSEAAKWNKIHLLAPFGVKRKEPGPVYNAVQVFDDQGKEIGSYAKTHLWGLENLYFAEGSEYPVFDTAFGKIGILVCYDLEFPEAAGTLALKGAEILFAPSAWCTGYERDWDVQLRQRAVDNGLFVVAVNKAGSEGDLRFLGKGKIHGPRGGMLAELPVYEEKVAVRALEIPARVPASGMPLEAGLAASSGEGLQVPPEAMEWGRAVPETDFV